METDSLSRLRLNRFAVLGRVGMDLYADPPGTAIEVAQGYYATIGGSAGNIAVALARQGAAAALVSVVSDDAVGRFCRAQLAGFGVECGYLGTVSGGARTSLAVTETRAVDCQTVLYRNNAADFALTPADVAVVDFAPVAALVVTGTALAAEPSRAATFAALAQARKAGALCVLDLDYRAYSWPSAAEAAEVTLAAARACDIVVGNDEEFGLLAGGMDQGRALAAQLAVTTARLAIYKRGAEGCTTFTRNRAFDTGIFPVRALKPTGAGDGFMGGCLAALAQGLPLDQAIRQGAATAAMIVAGIGCAPASPDRGALAAFLAEHQRTDHAHPAP